MIYYEKSSIQVFEDNHSLWEACEELCYDGRTVMSYSRGDITICGNSIVLPSVLPITFDVEQNIAENLVQITIMPGLDIYSIEIVYQTEKEDDEERW